MKGRGGALWCTKSGVKKSTRLPDSEDGKRLNEVVAESNAERNQLTGKTGNRLPRYRG